MAGPAQGSRKGDSAESVVPGEAVVGRITEYQIQIKYLCDFLGRTPADCTRLGCVSFSPKFGGIWCSWNHGPAERQFDLPALLHIL